MFNFFKKKNESKEDKIFIEKDNSLIFNIRCSKCGESINSYVNKLHDLSTNYESDDYAFLLNKTYVCPKCFNKIEMKIRFDDRYRVMKFDISGGEISKNE